MNKKRKRRFANKCVGLDEENGIFKCRITDVSCKNYNCNNKCCHLDCDKVDNCKDACKFIRILNKKTGEIKIIELNKGDEKNECDKTKH